MPHHEISRAATTEGLPVAPALLTSLEAAQVPTHSSLVDSRVLLISAVAMVLGLVSGVVAQVLGGLIRFFTNLSFFGRWSFDAASPADNHLGLWVIVVPVLGAIIVGLMARYGSKAIRGHGIPEAMEQVLVNESRIPARLTFLKPLSAAISIGTGGPFGAEGPIIATGGALGSLVGQIMSTTAIERKSLLAAGAAAGMAATFGSPVSAVLLAIELLLFEYRPRSLIPVALASTMAAAVRIALEGGSTMFPMPDLIPPQGAALAVYMAVGALVGVIAVLVTRAIYAIEDAFERLPIHWMWWPALGALAVGVVGYFVPLTLGVGYDNITNYLSGEFTVKAAAILCLAKFVSWSISLGSGTSGGTLAPLFTIGGGVGLLLGYLAGWLWPAAGIDARIAALVGMAAIFAAASRALLASIVFAFETTLQPLGLLPLLGGCTAAYLVSCFLMRHTIMTERIARRGIRAPNEYVADLLSQILVRDITSTSPVTLNAEDSIETVRAWIASDGPGSRHQGFPVLNSQRVLLGVLTRKDLQDHHAVAVDKRVGDLIGRPPIVVYDDCTVREAADHMLNHDVGRLPVVDRNDPSTLKGIVTRSDILSAYRHRLQETRRAEGGISLRRKRVEIPSECEPITEGEE